jgi:Ras-related protein Rab-1A
MSENLPKIINDTPIPCKVILVGESQVGKTSIISRYTKNLYLENTKRTLSAYSTKKIIEIDGYKIELQIWDTVGQEQYRSVTSIFYKEALVCILVYDITNRDSFDSIKNYWHNEIIKNGKKGVIIGIAGNKSDLYESEKVSEKEGQEYSDSINAYFKLVSAKNNISINEFFKSLVEKFVKSEFMDELLPQYVNDKNIIKKIKKMKLVKDKNSNEINKEGCC